MGRGHTYAFGGVGTGGAGGGAWSPAHGVALPIGRIVLVGVAVRAVGAEAGHDLHYIEKFDRVCE